MPLLEPLNGLIYFDTFDSDDIFPVATGIVTATDSDAGAILTFRLSGSLPSAEPDFDLMSDSEFGTFYLDSSDGDYKFVVKDSAVEGLRSIKSVSFVLFANDGIVDSAPGTITFIFRGFNDNVFGSESDEVFNTGAGDDVILGRGGNDAFYAEGGDDYMGGGAGNDIYYADPHPDGAFLNTQNVFIGGSDEDTAAFSDQQLNYFINRADSKLPELSNLLLGKSSDDDLQFEPGLPILLVSRVDLNGNLIQADYVQSERIDFADIVLVWSRSVKGDGLPFDEGQYYLRPENMADAVIYRGGGVNTQDLSGNYVLGGSNNDTLIGGDGNDILIGGDGGDILVAMYGDTILVGGAGADVFSFAPSIFDPVDTGQGQGPISANISILDFELGVDSVDFTGIFKSEGASPPTQSISDADVTLVVASSDSGEINLSGFVDQYGTALSGKITISFSAGIPADFGRNQVRDDITFGDVLPLSPYQPDL